MHLRVVLGDALPPGPAPDHECVHRALDVFLVLGRVFLGGGFAAHRLGGRRGGLGRYYLWGLGQDYKCGIKFMNLFHG